MSQIIYKRLINKFKLVRYMIYILTVICASLFISGCHMASQNPPAILIILIDETESFMKAGNWEGSLSVAVAAVESLRGKDALCVIGIDDHGFDQDDILIDTVKLPSASLKRIEVMQPLVREILALKPRETSSGYKLPSGQYKGVPYGTDTRGAVSHAAQIASYFKDYRVRLLLFTDFRDEPPEIDDDRKNIDIPFTGDCRLKALFIDESGGAEWHERLSKWTAFFNEIGVQCSNEDFYPPSMSNPRLAIANLRGFLY